MNLKGQSHGDFARVCNIKKKNKKKNNSHIRINENLKII